MMSVTLPATAELASFHQLNDQWAIHASINWTDWSSFKELTAVFPENLTSSNQKTGKTTTALLWAQRINTTLNSLCVRASHTTHQR